MPTALVTGANRGIGLEFCRQLSKQYQVTACCRQASSALNSLPVSIVEGFDVADFTNLADQVKQLVGPFDLVINNAGVLCKDAFDNIDIANLEHCLKVNAEAPLLLTSLLYQAGLIAKNAKLAFVTSRMGSMGDNDSGGRYAYRMSKAALNAACKSIAVDLHSEAIAVAILHPGYVKTDMTAQAGDVVPAVSVEGMIKIISELNMVNSGRFWHYQGHELPW